MSHREHKEPVDFSKTMRNQGRAGFGAGPWSDPAKIGVKPRPAVIPPSINGKRTGPPPVQPGKHAPCRLGDRILTGLAIMSLGMLIVGAMGAYLSNESLRMAATTRSETTAAAGLPESPDTRFLELERRLTRIDDLYGQRLHSLETKMEQTVEPYEARLATVENRLETSSNPDAGNPRDTGVPQPPFNASRYEARLKTLENRLEQAQAPYHAELRDMENRMGQNYASHEARLREMEDRLMHIQVPHEQRLQALEQRLIYASARLDYLSAEVESLIDNNSAIIQASAALLADPPAASPVATVGDATVNDSGPQWLQPSTTPATTEAAAASRAVEADDPTTAATPTPPVSGLATAISEAPMGTTADLSGGGVPTPGSTEVSHAGAVVTPTSQTVIAQANTPQAQAKPVDSAREVVEESTPDQTAAGDWVINLASYASESIAQRKLANFNRNGISAEQAVAKVNGKTIYRVRVAGFDSRAAAMARAETIQQQLGLKETWITRR
jgi:hypothetical protein